MKPLTIELLGLEQQDAQLFHSVFNGLERRIRRCWEWAADDADINVDLTVVDIDSIHGHMDWLKATGAGHRTAVYTSARHAKESDLALQKPLTAENLGTVLETVVAEHGEDSSADSAAASVEQSESVRPAQGTHSTAAAAAAVDPSPVASPTTAPTPAPTPASTPAPRPEQAVAASVHIAARTPAKAVPKSAPVKLPEPDPDPAPEPEAAPQPLDVGEWLRAGKVTQPTSIVVNDLCWLLDPDRDAYHGPAALKPLLDALSRPLDSLQPADIVALESARKQPSQPLARLRWVAGLHASPGRLLPQLADATSFRLSRWPQIEREYPRHFRIATAMMKQAGNVDDITTASGAPRNEVVDFINAYHTLGYIAREGGADTAMETPKGTVMSRIRKPFGR